MGELPAVSLAGPGGNGLNLVILILAAFVPGIFWVWFFYTKDRYESEPVPLLVRAFVFGMLAVVPAAMLEMPFREALFDPPHPIVRLLVSFLVVGLGEEFFKFLAVYLAVYWSKAFNEVMDGIIYAVTAALGFAAVENLIYASAFGLQVAPIRAVVGSLAHASFSGVMGFYLGWAKMRSTNPGVSIATGILVAAGLHGLYDYLILTQVVSPAMIFVMIVLLYLYLSYKIRKADALSPFRPE